MKMKQEQKNELNDKKTVKVRRRRCPLCNELDYPSNMIYAPVLIQEGVKFINNTEYVPNFVHRMRYVHKECYEREYEPLGSMKALRKLRQLTCNQTTLDDFI